MSENLQLSFRKVTIIGVGLIGGSIGMALKKNGWAREIVGVCRQHSSLVHALKNKAIDHGAHDIVKAVQNADLVILSTPVKTILELLPIVGKNVRRGAIITDVGSVKHVIVEAAQKVLPPHAFFVGSHPMAGSEKKGAQFADSELFRNSVCIMTPTDKTNKQAADKVKVFWTKLGCHVKTLTPPDHDKAVAAISHLPHLLAYGLISSVPHEALEFSAQGLKDTTRIASSDPELWRDILLTNSSNILKSLDEAIKNFSYLRKFIIYKDEENLLEYFKKAKQKRDGLEKT